MILETCSVKQVSLFCIMLVLLPSVPCNWIIFEFGYVNNSSQTLEKRTFVCNLK